MTPLPASSSAQMRYVFSRGELHKLPEKPPEFLASRLLSVPGRLRVLYELFVGGTDNPDETLAEFGTRRLGREAFGRLIDPMASGVFARIFRHEKAIPQYVVGHAARLEAIDRVLEKHPGLVLTGNAFRGVSLNDCVVNAWKTAQSLVPRGQ